MMNESLLQVMNFLSYKESFKLTLVNKRFRKKLEDTVFDGLWVTCSFRALLSKSGLTGLRNANLRNIDENLMDIHY